MKKNIRSFGVLFALVAALVMFMACNNVQEVTGDISVKKLGTVGEITVTPRTSLPTTTNPQVLVSWKGIADATNYRLYVKQNGNVTAVQVTPVSGPSNVSVYYANYTTAATPNKDSDIWYAVIDRPTNLDSGLFYIGVQASQALSGNPGPGDVKWSSGTSIL